MTHQISTQPLTAYKSSSLQGCVDIPGDKSISHRALILGALCVGETKISGLLESEDVLKTASAMRSFGADLIQHDKGEWSVFGVGVGGFCEPYNIVDCGNSGTAVRLIMGAVATTPITATFTGDASLNSRPMGRVSDPLALFGAHITGRSKKRLPLTLVGADNAVGIEYELPVSSAQVKSALLFGGLNALGQTTIIESVMTRDHTERMLKTFGAKIDIATKDNKKIITLSGQSELTAQKITIPRDPSSAAFFTVAALITPGSDMCIPAIGMNPTRCGLYMTLREMGAHIDYANPREEGGEPVVDLHVKASDLCAVDVPAERAASMIDEFPILAIAAAFAKGKTTMHGVGELRVKESDRIDAMARGLRANGVKVYETENMLCVHGMGDAGVLGGGGVQTCLDHRIAMSFLCLGLAAQKPVEIDDCTPIATSFPNFIDLMTQIGATISHTK